MSIMSTIFDVSIKEKRVYVVYVLSDFLSKWARAKKYMDLWQQANKYKQVVLETISWMFNGIQRVTYVTWAIK